MVTSLTEMWDQTNTSFYTNVVVLLFITNEFMFKLCPRYFTLFFKLVELNNRLTFKSNFENQDIATIKHAFNF